MNLKERDFEKWLENGSDKPRDAFYDGWDAGYAAALEKVKILNCREIPHDQGPVRDERAEFFGPHN